MTQKEVIARLKKIMTNDQRCLTLAQALGYINKGTIKHWLKNERIPRWKLRDVAREIAKKEWSKL